MLDLHALADRVFALSRAPVLVKFGGSVQDDPAQTASIIADISALARLGLRPIVVHGGGKAISAAMAGAGLQARFVLGQRYTDQATPSACCAPTSTARSCAR
jgi:acetylglutamate kinase